jgi:hypothetical protein
MQDLHALLMVETNQQKTGFTRTRPRTSDFFRMRYGSRNRARGRQQQPNCRSSPLRYACIRDLCAVADDRGPGASIKPEVSANAGRVPPVFVVSAQHPHRPNAHPRPANQPEVVPGVGAAQPDRTGTLPVRAGWGNEESQAPWAGARRGPGAVVRALFPSENPGQSVSTVPHDSGDTMVPLRIS